MEGGSAAAADAAEAVLVLQLGDHALGVGHPSLVRPDTGVAFRACPSLEREPLRVRARLATVARQHRLLRRDMRDDPSFGGRLPDALGREALVGADTRELRQREADTVEQRRERVALMALGPLAQAARDTTLLGIDADLAAVDEVRTLPRLPFSRASGSVVETAVAFVAFRFGVGPERGSARRSCGGPLATASSAPGSSFASPGIGSRLARRLRRAAFASAWKPSTERWLPSISPCRLHNATVCRNSRSNTSPSAKRCVCASEIV